MEAATAKRLAEANGAKNGRSRDQELVHVVGRHGAATVEQAMRATGVGRTATYRRVATCIEAGLLERLGLLRPQPSVLRATREGLRYAGLGLPVAHVSPSLCIHYLRCADVAWYLGEHFGHERILTERELVLAERIEGRPIASVRIGAGRNGSSGWHRPDLAVLAEAGTIAVEVELTPKAPKRLEGIIRAWRRASHVSEVRYLCEGGMTHRAVQRAVKATCAEGKVEVVDGVRG